MHTAMCPVDLLGNVPHNPVRFADTVGIVIERARPEKAIGMLFMQYFPPRKSGPWRVLIGHRRGTDRSFALVLPCPWT